MRSGDAACSTTVSSRPVTAGVVLAAVLVLEPRRQLPREFVEGAVFHRRQRTAALARRAGRNGKTFLGVSTAVSRSVGCEVSVAIGSGNSGATWRSVSGTAGVPRQAASRGGSSPATGTCLERYRPTAAAAPAVAEEFVAAQRGQPRQAVEIAANAEAAIAGKIPRAIEDRQARQFDRQPGAAVDRPVQRDAAPGLRAWQPPSSRGLRDRARRLRAISLHNRPKPAVVCGPIRRVNSSAPSEKRPSIHLPHEAQRKPPRMRRRLVEPGRRLDGFGGSAIGAIRFSADDAGAASSAGEGVGFVGDRFDVRRWFGRQRGGWFAAGRRGRGDRLGFGRFSGASASASNSAKAAGASPDRRGGCRFGRRFVRAQGRHRRIAMVQAIVCGCCCGCSFVRLRPARRAPALRRARHPARSARRGRYRRRRRRVAAPCGRCRSRLRRAPCFSASCAHRRDRPRTRL